MPNGPTGDLSRGKRVVALTSGSYFPSGWFGTSCRLSRTGRFGPDSDSSSRTPIGPPKIHDDGRVTPLPASGQRQSRFPCHGGTVTLTRDVLVRLSYRFPTEFSPLIPVSFPEPRRDGCEKTVFFQVLQASWVIRKYNHGLCVEICYQWAERPLICDRELVAEGDT